MVANEHRSQYVNNYGSKMVKSTIQISNSVEFEWRQPEKFCDDPPAKCRYRSDFHLPGLLKHA